MTAVIEPIDLHAAHVAITARMREIVIGSKIAVRKLRTGEYIVKREYRGRGDSRLPIVIERHHSQNDARNSAREWRKRDNFAIRIDR